MKTVRALFIVALATVSACGGVRDAIHDRPVSAAGLFDAREFVDVLPYRRIPAIERPRFESPAKADWLQASSPVVVVAAGADARAYPLAILLWHEVVDDVVGGTPVVVTYSPLTGAAAAYDRRVGGRTETFRVSGKLYRSDLVMADRRTRSLWLSMTGTAVAGPAKGTGMVRIPAQVASFAAFRESFPNGIVLSRETGVSRAYGLNPYVGYLTRTSPFPSFFAPRPDPELPAMERVVGLADGMKTRAYRVSRLAQAGVLDDRLGEDDIVLFWHRGTRSALDTQEIARGREVGATGIFLKRAKAGPLEFEATASGFRDRQTGSTWTVLGVATGGPLKGERLVPVTYLDAFWFAWAALHPDTTVSGS